MNIKWIAAVLALIVAIIVAFFQVRRPAPAVPSFHVNLQNKDGKLNVSSANRGPMTHGLLGDYFDEQETVKVMGDFNRIDPTIDFNWPTGFPIGTPIKPDANYSERWTGWVMIPEAGSWTWTVTADDGERLYIDAKLVQDDWTTHAPREKASTSTLTKGWHAIKLEHFNQASAFGNGGSLRLEWTGPHQPRAIVPSWALCYDPTIRPLFQSFTIGDRTYSLRVLGVRKIK